MLYSAKRYKYFKMSADSGKVIALLYHRIAQTDSSDSLIPGLINASLAEFEKEIEFLTKHFSIISIEEIVEAFRCGQHLPSNALIITFDDGYKDNYTYAYAVLKKFKIPATIFLTSDFIDNDKDLIWTDKVAYVLDKTEQLSIDVSDLSYDLANKQKKNKAKVEIIEYLKNLDNYAKNKIVDSLSEKSGVGIEEVAAKNLYLSSSEILEMDKGGISFGSHGRSHSILTRLKLQEARDEILESKLKIEEIIGREIISFAYPNGTRFDFNNELIEILRECGYKIAFTAIPAINELKGDTDIFALNRVSAGRSFTDLKKNVAIYF